MSGNCRNKFFGGEVNAVLGKELFELFGDIPLFISAATAVQCAVVGIAKLAEGAERPISFCSACFVGKASVVKGKFKPVLCGVISDGIEFREECLRFGNVFVLGLEQIDKACDGVDFTCVPCRNIEQEAALLSQLSEGVKLVGELKRVINSACLVNGIILEDKVVQLFNKCLLKVLIYLTLDLLATAFEAAVALYI